LDPVIYIAIFLPLFIVFLQQSEQKKVSIKQHILSKKRRKENTIMIELAKSFIGKECLVYTFNSQLAGILKEVSNGALLLENGKNLEIINLDYIIRIREHPTGKNRRKKSVVLD